MHALFLVASLLRSSLRALRSPAPRAQVLRVTGGRLADAAKVGSTDPLNALADADADGLTSACTGYSWIQRTVVVVERAQNDVRTGADDPSGHVHDEPRADEHRLAEWFATQPDGHNAALPLCNRLHSSGLPSSARVCSTRAWRSAQLKSLRERGFARAWRRFDPQGASFLTSPIA